MLEKQKFFDLHEHEESFGDPRSWLLGEEDNSHSSSPSQHSLSNGNGNNFDPVLYRNLVEVLPLLESFIEVKSKTSFTRKASLVYTKTPTKGSNLKKGREPKGKKIAHPIPAIKQTNIVDNKPNTEELLDDLSIIPPKNTEELQEQVENLREKLMEKDELLRSAEASRNEMMLIHAKIDALKRQLAEKESLIKSAQIQLSDVNVKLADKQVTLEKMQLELSNCNKKVDELESEMESIQGERAAFGYLAETMATNSYSSSYTERIESWFGESDNDMSEKEMKEIEEAREAYVLAVAAAKDAKDEQDEELLGIAVKARLKLQGFVLLPKCCFDVHE